MTKMFSILVLTLTLGNESIGLIVSVGTTSKPGGWTDEYEFFLDLTLIKLVDGFASTSFPIGMAFNSILVDPVTFFTNS